MTIKKIPVEQINSQEILEFPILNVNLLGRQVTFITVSDIVDTIDTACVKKKKIVIANYNVHSFNLSMQIPWFYSFLQNSEIAHCDSVGILKATEWMGLKLPLQYRASYTLLMPKLLEHCNQQEFSIFLLGAKPEHSDTAIERLQAQYPKMVIKGHHGYFDRQDPYQNNEVVQKINQANPNILIVGMGMPIQENWIYMNRERINTNVIMAGGAAIDRLAGVVPDCPAFLSNIGLEWLYRLCREPKRLATRYLIGNLAFILHIILAKSYSPSLEVQLKDNLIK
jgi:N-acetylglucosaminyldiphosphoundecaprenol N-acetyl-beta-D-mannosaminyltransferase